MQPNNPQAINNEQPPFPSRPVVSVVPRPRTKSKFLTFMCSLIPGAGQMYFGLYKKGISIMSLFCGIIFLATTLYLPSLTVILPIIYFYSFFESVNRMNMPVEQVKFLKDDWMFIGSLGFNEKCKGFFEKTGSIGLWIGVAVFAIGIYALFSGLSNVFAYFGNYEIYNWIRLVLRWTPSLVIPIICILIGIRLIVGRKTVADSDSSDSEEVKSV